MAESSAGVKPENLSKILLLLLLVALFAPHTLSIRGYSYYPDEAYTRYSLIAGFWSIIWESGTSISGPYTTTSIVLPIDAILLWAAFILPLTLYILYTQGRFMRGIATKKTMFYTILSLLVVQVVLTGFLCYSLDGWLVDCSYPIPVFQLASFLATIPYQK